MACEEERDDFVSRHLAEWEAALSGALSAAIYSGANSAEHVLADVAAQIIERLGCNAEAKQTIVHQLMLRIQGTLSGTKRELNTKVQSGAMTGDGTPPPMLFESNISDAENAFKHVDQNGDGHLTVEELVRALHAAGTKRSISKRVRSQASYPRPNRAI